MMTEPDCIFCRIVRGEVPADVVYESAAVVVVRDRHPQAPVHLLALPRDHLPTLNDAPEATIAELFRAAKAVACTEGFAERGYRTVINVQREGGQTVWHLHLHILAGRDMRWPPG